MKQKVTIKLGMECESCRNTAMKIASMIKGVTAVAIEGDCKDLLVVTGEDIDTICLGKNLKMKFRIVTVISVEEVKPKNPDDKGKEKPKEKPKDVIVCVPQPAHPCVRCCRPTCDGGCKPCCKCQSPRCEGKCEPCGKCGSHKCEGGCKACYRCRSYSCRGVCAVAICYGQCPPWISCPSCCSKPSPALCYYNVVCEQKPEDSCSIQ